MSGFGLSPFGLFPWGFGSTGYVLGTAKLIIPHNAAYGTQKITISFDARMTDASDYALIHKMVAGKEEWGFLQNSGTLSAVMYEGVAASAITASPETNLFQSFVGVYDGINWEFFIDNVSQGTVAIGTRDLFDGQIEVCLNGAIRNIRIFDTDLTASEVEDVTYNRNIPITNLVGEWLVNDNAAVVTDSVGSNDGSIVSGTWCGGEHDASISSEDWGTYSADCISGSGIDWPVAVDGTSSTSLWDVDTDDHQFLQSVGYFYRSDPYDTITLQLHLESSLDATVYVHFDYGTPAGIGTVWDRNASATVIAVAAGDDGWFSEDFTIPAASGEHQLINVWLSAERDTPTDEGLMALHQVRMDWKIA